MKVIINKCFGGFGLSKKALERYKELAKIEEDIFGWEIDREDDFLIQVIEELGEEANGSYAKLQIVEIPDDVEYEITDYDGIEKIEEVHQSWG